MSQVGVIRRPRASVARRGNGGGGGGGEERGEERGFAFVSRRTMAPQERESSNAFE